MSPSRRDRHALRRGACGFAIPPDAPTHPTTTSQPTPNYSYRRTAALRVTRWPSQKLGGGDRGLGGFNTGGSYHTTAAGAQFRVARAVPEAGCGGGGWEVGGGSIPEGGTTLQQQAHKSESRASSQKLVPTPVSVAGSYSRPLPPLRHHQTTATGAQLRVACAVPEARAYASVGRWVVLAPSLRPQQVVVSDASELVKSDLSRACKYRRCSPHYCSCPQQVVLVDASELVQFDLGRAGAYSSIVV